MKKAYRNSINKKCFLGIIVCLVLFNLLSCGLDTFYVMDQPTQGSQNPIYSSIEENLKYFEFYTNEDWYDPTAGFKFSGTDVYYRIYNNSDTLVSETSRIQTESDVNSSSSNALTYLIDTYKYSRLKMEGNKKSTLIPFTGKDRLVTIRLTDFDENNKARIAVDNVTQGYPLRNSSEALSFEFARTEENIERNKKPEEGDNDVKFGTFSVTGPNEWYVALFAIAVGRDDTFSEIMSMPVYLGSICIPEK